MTISKYIALVDKIKIKSKKRKVVFTKKKETPVIHVLKYRDPAKWIAELTEELEKLRYKKTVLLQQMQFPEDSTAGSFRKEICTLEDGLKGWKNAKPSMPSNWIMP